MDRFARRLFVFAFLLLAALVPLASPVLAQTGQGQWQTLPYTMPINPIHAALLNNGKAVIVSGSGHVAGNTSFRDALWAPEAGTITTHPVGWDMFCNGRVVLPDESPLVLGCALLCDPLHA